MDLINWLGVVMLIALCLCFFVLTPANLRPGAMTAHDHTEPEPERYPDQPEYLVERRSDRIVVWRAGHRVRGVCQIFRRLQDDGWVVKRRVSGRGGLLSDDLQVAADPQVYTEEGAAIARAVEILETVRHSAAADKQAADQMDLETGRP